MRKKEEGENIFLYMYARKPKGKFKVKEHKKSYTLSFLATSSSTIFHYSSLFSCYRAVAVLMTIFYFYCILHYYCNLHINFIQRNHKLNNVIVMVYLFEGPVVYSSVWEKESSLLAGWLPGSFIRSAFTLFTRISKSLLFF